MKLTKSLSGYFEIYENIIFSKESLGFFSLQGGSKGKHFTRLVPLIIWLEERISF